MRSKRTPGLPQRVQQPARLDESEPVDARQSTVSEHGKGARAGTAKEAGHACATVGKTSEEVSQAFAEQTACATPEPVPPQHETVWGEESDCGVGRASAIWVGIWVEIGEVEHGQGGQVQQFSTKAAAAFQTNSA